MSNERQELAAWLSKAHDERWMEWNEKSKLLRAAELLKQPPLVWTTEPPTDGNNWYWYAVEAGPDSYVDVALAEEIPETATRFAGPIPEPQEAE